MGRAPARSALCLALLLLVLAPGAVRSGQDPTGQQISLLLRVLAYDRSLRSRAGDAVTVAVAYNEADPASVAAQRSAIADLVSQGGRAKVSGMPLRAVAVPFADIGPFAARLVQERAAAIFVCPGMADRVARIVHIARRRSILTFGGSEADVRAGLSVGLVPRQDRVGILVNLPEVHAEGASLDAALLRVAEVLQ